MNDNKPTTRESMIAAAQAVIGSLLLTAFVLCLFAPLFGPKIQRAIENKNCMYEDWYIRSRKEMRPYWVLLWIVCILGWIVYGFAFWLYYG